MEIQIGALRASLKYKNRVSMERPWHDATGSPLPDDLDSVPCAVARKFLQTLVKPQRGRSKSITEAACFLLENLECPEVEPETLQKVEPELPTLQKVEKLESEETHEVSQHEKAPGFIREFIRVAHPADLLYYACVGIAGAGAVSALDTIGWAVAGIYMAVAVLALYFIKVREGWARMPHLLAMGIVEIVGAVSHISWANTSLWKRINSLPLKIWVEKYQNGAGETVAFMAGPDAEKPFAIACGIAAVMFFCGVYVVAISIQNSNSQK